MPADPVVRDRVRAALAAEPTLREVPMFGGLSFMVDDRMVVSLRGVGDLLVRVDPDRSATLVAEHGAQPAEMGPGRAMGPGWLDVAPDLVATDDGLTFWIAAALEHHRAAATGRAGSPRRGRPRRR